MTLSSLTLEQISNLLEKREASATEVASFYLERIKKTNKKLNAYLSIFEKQAISQARQSDLRRKNNKTLGPLDGVPIAVKDNIAIAGEKTTAGSKMLENFTSPYNATVIAKLKKQGMVFLGKTNLDEFAMGSSTENSAYGVTKNPWDFSRVSGGSSGGSAAAVAASLAPVALGSDTGGSIRQPASFCGTVGIKPTYGRVSRYGLLAMASSLDQIGTFSKTASDSKILLNAISGWDKQDATSTHNKEAKSGVKSLKGLKIGVPKEVFDENLDKKVAETFKDALFKMEKAGAKIVELSLPYNQYAVACYYIIVPSEVSSNLARYDGIKYGYKVESREPLNSTRDRQRGESLIDLYKKTRAEGFGDEAKRRIMLGSFTLSAGYYEAYYKKAMQVRTLIKQDYERIFKLVDVLATPTAPTVAFGIGEKIKNPLQMYLADIFTVPVNLAGLPAVSIPCGFSGNLPVGLQLIGPAWGENLILDTASLYEEVTKDEEWRSLNTKF